MPKATNTNVFPEGGEDVTKVKEPKLKAPKATSIIKPNELLKKFGKIDDKIAKYEEISVKIFGFRFSLPQKWGRFF